MPTLQRAKVIAAHMGPNHNIYWDMKHACYRVMKATSLSLWINRNNYEHIYP
jgi:hypothetical protein